MTQSIPEWGENQPDEPQDPKSAAADAECAEFQASMAERIGDGEDLQQHPHMLACERCSALVGELEEIAKVARMLIPVEIEPREDLWSKIERKLDLESSETTHNGAGSGRAPTENSEETAAEIPLEGGLALEGGVA